MTVKHASRVEAYPVDNSLNFVARAETEAARRQREREYRALFDQAPDAILIAASDGKYLDANARALDLLGYTCEELRALTIADVIVVSKEPLASSLAALRPGETLRGEREARRKDGTSVAVEISERMLGDGRIQTILRDITGRLAAAAAEVEHERLRLGEIVANIPGFVWESQGAPDTAAYLVTFVNDYVVPWLGYSTEEWLNNPGFGMAITHPEDRSRVARERLAIFTSGTSGTIRFRWITRDGRIVWAETHATAILDEGGVPVGLRGVTLDISARVEAEAALRASEELYRITFTAAPVGIITVDPHGAIIYANRVFQELLGYDEDEVRRVRYAMVGHPDDVAEGLQLFDDLRAGRRDRYEREGRYYRKDGALIWTRLTSAAVRDQAGSLLHIVTMIEDITERKRVERQRAVQHVVNRALAEARTVAGAASAFLDVLAAGMGYDCAALWVLDERDARLHCVGVGSVATLVIDATVGRWAQPLARSKGLPGRVLARRAPIPQPNGRASDDREWREAARVAGFAVASGYPVRADSKVVGVLEFFGQSHDRHDQEVATLEVVGGAIGQFIERKRADAALGRANEFRERVMESAITAIAALDLEGRFVLANRQAAELSGYSPEELVGNRLGILLPPEEQKRVGAVIAETLQAGTRTSWFETTIIRKDGARRMLGFDFAPLMEDGRITGAVGIAADITERRQARQALLDSEAKFRGAFNHAAIGMGLITLDGCWLQVNAALCQLLGRSAEELLATTSQALTHPDDREADGTFLHLTAAGVIPTAQREQRYIHKDGHVVWVLLSVSLVRTDDDAPAYLIAQVQDITEIRDARELLERQVAARTRAMATLLEVSRDVASALDLPSLLGSLLDRLHLVVPYDEAELSLVERDTITRIEYRGPLPRATVVGARIPLAGMVAEWAIVQQGQPIIIGDVQALRRSDATPIHSESAIHTGTYLGVPVLVNGQAIGTLVLRHREADAYTQRQAEFAQLLAGQAAIAIESARLHEERQREGILEERQRLARELHDSVTQGLYGMTMYAGAAGRLLAAGERDEAAELVGTIGVTAQEALQEMRLMLFELRSPTLEQEGLAGALRARLATLRRRESVLLITDALDDDIHLPAPVEEALYRVAQEAMTNARKHARAHTMQVSLSQDDRAVTLMISDDGIGFDPAATGQAHGRLGLRGIAERVAAVGGTLAVDSAPGRGTVVCMEVPR